MLLVKVILVYLLLSFTEWLIHSKVMHGDADVLIRIPLLGKKLAHTATMHRKHHESVELDMSISGEINKNTLFFKWSDAFVFFIIIFGPMYLILKDVKTTVIVTLSSAIIYCFLWNNIHVDMHKSDIKINASEGVPNVKGSLSKGPLYEYLHRYHNVHHSQKGQKYNHNIILPGVDFIMGTYHGFYFDNSDYCDEHIVDTRCFEKKYGYI